MRKSTIYFNTGEDLLLSAILAIEDALRPGTSFKNNICIYRLRIFPCVQCILVTPTSYIPSSSFL